MDAEYQPPEFEHAPQRVVSLVPSITESLFVLGLGDRLVGATEFCVHPAALTGTLPKVGGTKNASAEAILALQPDLVLANKEENSPELVRALQAAGTPVWLTFPRSVDAAVDVLYGLAGLFRNQQALLSVKSLATAVDYARAASAGNRVRYFCPVWFDRLPDGTPWWMTFNRDTYPADLLSVLGGENVFSERERRYPLDADLGRALPVPAGERDVRYPRLTGEEIRRAAPEIVLLPSEPYTFEEEDVAPLREILGGGVRFAFLDGSLLTWHGTRLAQALRIDLAAL